MPNMASLTVKKADEVTNITYDALTGAAGDGSLAVWRQDTGAAGGMPVGHRATLTMGTVFNGPRTARRATIIFKRPYTTQNTVTSKYETKDSVVARLELTMPLAIPATDINEGVYQFLNCVAAALIKQSVAAGYAPQ
ncbi:coat protein [ssRNA phage SRR6960803_10]|uniref:Coat protein n=1 Tax=ssRNA phage SRR6960803_10 TaxID=2786613 RepID=A0A8S5KZL8_9VIRU|nr:coat protein [ssRNA phage SRR6960803_10]DAD50752.1 TPA_asm: coat protein [ssRNA phage SRR6960803_10]